ncbi:MAG: hypothetical protein ACKOCH_18305, partial [Bacteroidota bacterium]
SLRLELVFQSEAAVLQYGLQRFWGCVEAHPGQLAVSPLQAAELFPKEEVVLNGFAYHLALSGTRFMVHEFYEGVWCTGSIHSMTFG